MNLDRVIAVRNAKTIYRDGDQCVKVFNENYSKADILNEVKVGAQDVVGSLVVQHTDEKCHNAFHDEGVALSLEMNLPFRSQVGLQPHTALATIDEVALHLILLWQWLLLTAKVNEHLILIHPIIKVFKLFDNFLLSFFYCHNSFISYDINRQSSLSISPQAWSVLQP